MKIPEKDKLAHNLIDFIDKSTSPFHCIDEIRRILNENGFSELIEGERWKPITGEKYYTVRNGSALIAFTIADKSPADYGFRIIGTHSDSPGFRIKSNALMISEKKYLRLNTEIYGGPIINTWLDRPLSIAGRIACRSGDPLKPEIMNICIDEPLLVIPNLAIHMNRDVNKGIELNAQKDTLPLLGLAKDSIEKDNYLIEFLAEKSGIKADEIIDFDLFLYDNQKGCITGLGKEFISSGRIDNLESVHAALKALVSCSGTENNVLAVFNNEEVGSLTMQGADSNFLSDVLERIVAAAGGDREDFFRSLSSSFMISADTAHALHPNRDDKADPTHRPVINQGPVIKISASSSYTSDSYSIAVFEELCRKTDVPVQKFYNRSDQRGGSTIGPVSSAHVAVRCVDVGIPILAMHSVRELCGVDDHEYITQVFYKFYG